MSLSGIAKFLIGFILGVALLAGSAAVAAYYFWTQLSTLPTKPVFPEEKSKTSPSAKKTSSPTASQSGSNKQPTSTKLPPKELPPGAYKVRVNWSQGLILRDAPGPDATRIGGVTFNQELIVLKESDDQKWQKVRFAESDQEGWIKAGNTERVND
jgi:hypothetical protein